ncbi:MAG TPA: sugar ABC transporter permease [Candidatus Limnocylindrales bacterium]|nr:sugar ABC transporter permease [Candidatus Limnocylindrales bacterium]
MTAIAQPPGPSAAVAAGRSRLGRFAMTRGERRTLRTGLFFISPWLLGFLAFIVYPALASLYYSFTNFKIRLEPQWIGLSNYQELLRDPLFWRSLGNTLYLTFIAVPLAVLVALSIALLLNRKQIRGIGVFRTIFYLPVVVPAVAGAILWIFLLNPENGLVNQLLAGIGISGPGWFYDPEWAKNGIVLLMVWSAGDVVIIYLGALQGVPRALYEAAEVDGAGAWVKLRHVTIPMISPAILFNLITGAIGAFQYFTQPYIIGNAVSRGTNDTSIGGVQNSLLMYGLHLYNNGFRYFRMGYASALAWLLLLTILGTTLVLLRVSRNRVYYESER